ncbi:MAG TPA: hypothetical protein VF411_09045 [Bacteroidia bacterium]
MKNVASGNLSGEVFFNTLGQSGTSKISNQVIRPQITINGNGSELSNDAVLKNKAKRKTITQKVILSLIKVATKKGQTERIQPYRNTYYCQNSLITTGSRQYGKFCKSRICTGCCANRKGETINNYLPIIETWEEPYFVTLTVRAVPAHRLKFMIEKGLIRALKIIINRHKKRNQRRKGIKLVGIKSLECNFNPIKRTYNPHIHLIVANKEMADILINDWLALWTIKFASIKGQFSRPVLDTQNDLVETIKYGSKIFTDPLMRKKSKQKITPYIYVSALNNILWAMKDHRIFGSFGFYLPKTNKSKGRKEKTVINYDEWQFSSKKADWVNIDDANKLLTGYVLTSELKDILNNNIDEVLE